MKLDSLGQFLRCAARLEADAADGYEQLAASIDRTVQPELHGLFCKFADFSRLHLNEVLKIQRNELAREYAIDDERFEWPDGLSPENPLALVNLEDITPMQALHCALEVERRACDFYAHIAGRTRSPRVQELAQEFAEEEGEHVAHVQRWIERARG
ncbi:MAG: ferritin-like domain-containing protein [Wenzhouxiangellaceae bacterium]